jgi:histidine phosphotransferase ChpT
MQQDQPAEARTRPLRLAELLATRLCHDLGGPLSGLVAALGEVGVDPEALTIAGDASRTLRRRLALARAAWGAAGPALPGAELLVLAEGLPHAHKLRLDLAPPLAAATWPPALARVLLNALIVAAESLPLGGAITVRGTPGEATVLALEGRRAAWPEGFGAMLASEEAAWQGVEDAAGLAAPRRLQPALTALLAHDAGIAARLLLGPGREALPPLLLPAPV